jgi:hypothetical protein
VGRAKLNQADTATYDPNQHFVPLRELLLAEAPSMLEDAANQ